MGEISSKYLPDYQYIARNVLARIGYTSDEAGLNCDTCKYLIDVVGQSPDIALGVDIEGAGDQGMVFGYATDETENYMPYAIDIANKISKACDVARLSGKLPWALPDGKCQVTVKYDENTHTASITDIVVSIQHKADTNEKTIDMDIVDIITKTIPEEWWKNASLHVNPTGRFVIGGPAADIGLTGRKIVVDTYGGSAPHGGGAFSGKDPTKVDRSGAYMARYIAKNVVASGVAKKCQVQIAYIIGETDPISINVETFGTSRWENDQIEDAISNVFNLKPKSIIEALDLRHTSYEKLATYGHFGKEGYPWENTDKAEEFLEYVEHNCELR